MKTLYKCIVSLGARLFAGVAAHLSYFREIYGWLPLAIGLIVGALTGIPLLTGRAVLDDPGAIAGWLYNFAGVVLVFILVGFAKPHLFDDLDTRQPGLPFNRILLDSCETVFLLLFAAGLVFFR